MPQISPMKWSVLTLMFQYSLFLLVMTSFFQSSNISQIFNSPKILINKTHWKW